MRGNAFVYNGFGCFLDSADWIEKPGVCECKKNFSECPLLTERSINGKCNSRCDNNLVAHCCKHVICGTDVEQEHYIENTHGGDIPVQIRSKKDEVIKNYRNLSRDILNEPHAICITGHGEKIRIVCEAQGSKEGFVDYLSYESRWEKDNWDNRMKPTRYKQIGIVSSYYNYSSPEIFVLFRLVHQKYYERLSQGINVSPALRLDGGYYDDERTGIVPQIDIAFDQGALFYLQKEDKNYSVGVIYSFFYEKYHELLDDLYYDFSAMIDLRKESIDEFIWGLKHNMDLESELKFYVKINDRVYNSRVIMQYLLITSENDFRPDLIYGNERTSYLPEFASVLEQKQLKGRKTALKSEMIILRRYASRRENTYGDRYSEKNLYAMKEFIEENQRDDDGVGSTADYAAYTVVSQLIEYFMAIYVLEHYHKRACDKKSKRYEMIRARIQKFLGFYQRFCDVMKCRLVLEWLDIFNDLFDFREHIDELKCSEPMQWIRSGG